MMGVASRECNAEERLSRTRLDVFDGFRRWDLFRNGIDHRYFSIRRKLDCWNPLPAKRLPPALSTYPAQKGPSVLLEHATALVFR